jgi:peptidoglycan/xylan/chitin deacetylase (PgdA/CDA1 family)
LKRVVYPCLANSGYLRRRAARGSLCVITYHGILPRQYQSLDREQDGALVSPANFRSQLRLLKERYHVVTPQQFRDWIVDGQSLPEQAILLTCDDGLLNLLTSMVPILREEELSCLFFVLGASVAAKSSMLWYEELYLMLLAAPDGKYTFESAGVLDLPDKTRRRSAWWNLVTKLSQYDSQYRVRFLQRARFAFGLPENWNELCWNDEGRRQRFSILNISELRQLAEQGMSIGSHTLSHPVLSQQSSDYAWREISESRNLLERALGQSVWALAYPYGDPASVIAREIRMAEEAGFQCAFMNVGGGFGAHLPRFAIPRVHVTAEMNLAEFEAHVSGFHRDFRSRVFRRAA